MSIMLVLGGLSVSVFDILEYLLDPAAVAQQARQNGMPQQPAQFNPNNGQPVQPAFDWFNDVQRIAAGLVVSGLMHGLLFYLVLRFATNDRQFPAVRRAFLGMRFVLILLVVTTTSTVAIIMTFRREEMDLKFVEVAMTVACVWAPAALIHGFLLMKSGGWKVKPKKPVDTD